MRRTFRTLNDCEMQYNAEVGLFTKPSILIGIIIAVLLNRQDSNGQEVYYDKVVLLTDRPEECETPIPYLKIPFPECEIRIQPKRTAKLQCVAFALEPSTSYRMFIIYNRNSRKIMEVNHC